MFKRKRYGTRANTKKLKMEAQSWLWRLTKIRNFNDLATDEPILKDRKFSHVHSNRVTILHDCFSLRKAIIATGNKIDYYSKEPLTVVEMNRLDRLCKHVDPDLKDIDEEIHTYKLKKNRKNFIDFVWTNKEHFLYNIILQINACINDKYQRHFTLYLISEHLFPTYKNEMHKLCELDRSRAERLHMKHLEYFKPDDEKYSDSLSMVWFTAHVGVKGDLARQYIDLNLEDTDIEYCLGYN